VKVPILLLPCCAKTGGGTSSELMLKAPYILLAEDSDDDTFFTRRCLAAAGIELELRRCADGLQVCEFLRKCGDDLPLAIVLDLKMPLMDGFETLQWIREQPAFGHLPIVILSSSEMQQDVARAKKLGCTEYLVKPHSLPELEKLLKGLIERLLAKAGISPVSTSPKMVRPSP
jgi:CheY-like chemotaxis protein